MAKATDMVKVPESEWDKTPEEMRAPYIEQTRKNGYVYAIRAEEKKSNRPVALGMDDERRETMKMITFILIGFERWGGLKPAWKIDPQGRKWYPLIRGIWRRGRRER